MPFGQTDGIFILAQVLTLTFTNMNSLWSQNSD